MPDQLPPPGRYADVHTNDEQQRTPSALPSSAPELKAKVTKLHALKEQGVLDDEEFWEAKRRLLGFW